MKKKIVIFGSTGSIGKIFLNILKKDIALTMVISWVLVATFLPSINLPKS